MQSIFSVIIAVVIAIRRVCCTGNCSDICVQGLSCRAECYNLSDPKTLPLSQDPKSYVAGKFVNSVLDLPTLASLLSKSTAFEFHKCQISINVPCKFAPTVTMASFSQSNIIPLDNFFRFLSMPNRGGRLSLQVLDQNASINMFGLIPAQFPTQFDFTASFEETEPKSIALYVMHKHFQKLTIRMMNICYKCDAASWLLASLANPKLTVFCYHDRYHRSTNYEQFCQGHKKNIPNCQETNTNQFICNDVSSFYKVFLAFLTKGKTISTVTHLKIVNNKSPQITFDVDTLAAQFIKLDSLTLSIDHISFKEEGVMFPESLKHIKFSGSSLSFEEMEKFLGKVIIHGQIQDIQIEDHRTPFTFAVFDKLPAVNYNIAIRRSNLFDPYTVSNNPNFQTFLKSRSITIEDNNKLICNCLQGLHLISAISANDHFRMKCIDPVSRREVLFNMKFCEANQLTREGDYIMWHWLGPLIGICVLLLLAMVYCIYTRRTFHKTAFVRPDEYDDSTLFGTAISFVYPSGGPEG